MKSNRIFKVILLMAFFGGVINSFGQIADSMQIRALKAIELSTGANGQIDPPKAYQTLLGLAQQGFPIAMNAIGRLCIEGNGCPVNGDAGVEWLNKAGEAGYYSAWHNLGTIYKYGRSGIKQDFELSFYYFNKLAQTTCTIQYIGLYDTGYMLYKGLGCIQSYEKAYTYFKLGAEKNFPPCMYMLALCHRNGYGVPRNTGEANYWLSQAIREGYSPAIDEFYADGPENTPVRVKVRSANLLDSPKECLNIQHFKQIDNAQLDGEYEGVLVTYDWSGKVALKETPLYLSVSTDKKNLVAEWREQGADTMTIKGEWKDSTLFFSTALHGRQGHYDAGKKVQWTFINAQLKLLGDDSNSYIAGNLQMYSPETMEPHQPTYLNLRKISGNKQSSPLNQKSFLVYPNPFEDGLNISFYQPKESEVIISVSKTDGQKKYRTSLGVYKEGQQDITLSLSLTTGVYLLRLTSGNFEYQTVIIRK